MSGPTDLQRVVLVGAPFMEGQNLEGADLGPTALREAGLGRACCKLGWKWEDTGDIDFAKHFEDFGFSPKGMPTRDNIELYREWLAEGQFSNFSEWVSKRKRKSIKRKWPEHCDDGVPDANRPERAALRPVAHELQGVCELRKEPVCNIVNAERMSSGLHLVHNAVLKAAESGAFVLTAGGDHSIASGSISAICQAHPDVGVIWIDAHADANTPLSSPTGHYHGMPAAHLMGWFGREQNAQALPGFQWFPAGCLPETKLAYIGLRDVDREEGELLRRSAVSVFTMRDIDKYGIAKVCEMAIKAISGPDGSSPIHLSLDIDGVDPHFAPGTGTAARGGLSYREIHYICEECAVTKRLVSMDLVELNPALDTKPHEEAMHGDNDEISQSSPTVRLAAEVVLSALGKQIIGNVDPAEYKYLGAR